MRYKIVIKNLLKNISISFITIFIFLIIFEIILRLTAQVPSYYYPRNLFIADKELGYKLKPNFQAVQTLGEYKYMIKINSNGLRDREYGSKGSFRILALGDSFTFGTGLEMEYTYLAVLEGLINSSGKLKCEVIKSGVPGYGTEQEFVYLKSFGLKYKPDIVLIGFCIPNDPDDNMREKDTVVDGFLVSSKAATYEKTEMVFLVKAFLRRHIYIYSFVVNKLKTNPKLCNIIYNSKIGLNVFEKELQFYRQNYSEKTKKAFEKTFAILKDFKYFTDKEGIKLCIVLIPTRTQIDINQLRLVKKQFNLDTGDCDVSKPTMIMVSFLKKQGIDFLDLTPVLKEEIKRGKRLYYVLDGHWNKEGAVCAGMEIFNHLSSSGYFNVK